MNSEIRGQPHRYSVGKGRDVEQRQATGELVIASWDVANSVGLS